MIETGTAKAAVRSLETIGKLLFETQAFWAKPLGVSVPQWSILSAIAEMDRGDGVPVAEVAKRCRVDPSFVTAQTKLLEKSEFLTRRQSPEDGRVMLMALTDRARRSLNSIDARREALNQFIFASMSDSDGESFLETLEMLEKRFAQAPHVLALDAWRSLDDQRL